MNTVLSAVFGDLTSRFISFIIQQSQQIRAATNNDNEISRLQRLLLRAGTVVAEAEGRRVTNPAMLLQLKQLREAVYRGYYLMDDTTTSIVPASRARRWPAVVSNHKLHSDIDNLEAMLDGMNEFLLILMHCPPIVRQPYSANLFMQNCMFGRHAEKERIVNFLLHPCSSSLDVLPVVGPCYVGKRTLVEHICREEAVQRNFSRIMRFSSNDLSDLLAYNNRGNLLGLSDGGSRYLIIVELVRDTDVVAWGEIHNSLRHGADGIKIKVILISRMDRVSSLGTVQAFRLTRLHQEEYWYFFRVLAFGSANPYDHHPDLASIAKEIVTEVGGSFMIAHTITSVLRANMNVPFWRHALWCIRKSMQMHKLVLGEDLRDTQSSKRYLSYFHSFRSDSPLLFFSLKRYQTESVLQRDIASMRPAEKVLITDLKSGDKFDAIFQSHIPPYCYCISSCVVEKPKILFDAGNKQCLKRKRNR